jgi:hypothetical protein
MFTNISWTNYIIVIILLLVIYYIIIGILFYSRDLKSLLSGTQKFKLSASIGISDVQNDINPIASEQAESEIYKAQNAFDKTNDEISLEVEHLIIKLKEAIADAFHKKYIQAEFFLYLQLIINEYPMVKNSQFQSVINELIISECGKYGSVIFNEEEVGLLWNDVV